MQSIERACINRLTCTHGLILTHLLALGDRGSGMRTLTSWLILVVVTAHFLGTNEAIRPFTRGGENRGKISSSHLAQRLLVRRKVRVLIISDRKREVPGGPDPQHHR